MTKFARALVAYQRQHGLRQCRLAESLGVSRHWLNDFIAGRRRPNWKLAVRAYSLGVPAEAILEDSEEAA